MTTLEQVCRLLCERRGMDPDAFVPLSNSNSMAVLRGAQWKNFAGAVALHMEITEAIKQVKGTK